MTEKEFLNAVARNKEDVVQLLLDILSQTGAPYCVIGGLAVNAYAEPVVSLDLDIVVSSETVAEVMSSAESHGFKMERFEHSINLKSRHSQLRIQLQTDARYQEFIGRSEEKETLGYKMRVADAADVLQGKLWAYQDETRRKSKRQKDLADILRLVEAKPGLTKLLPPQIREQVE
jgi:hypothetical protein